MASGQFHGMVSITAGLVAGGALYYATRDIVSASALGGACMAGVVISPDLDEPNPTHSHTEVRNGCGMIFGILWWIFWQPYAWIVRRHRALLSHFPILSTAGRVGYTGTIMLPILWMLKSLGRFASLIKGWEKVDYIGIFIQPIWARIQPHVQFPFPIPGVNLWIIFLITTLILTGLSILKVDLMQNAQKKLFWIVMGISAALIMGWFLVRWVEGDGFMIAVPIGAWMFMGLGLSDLLHAVVDWFLPGWL